MMKFITSLMFLCVLIPILLLVIFTPEKCEHEMSKRFSFASYDSTATSNVTPFCKKCNHFFGYTLFHNTPEDTSYLEVVEEHSDASEIVAGEYYTITATVTLGYYGYGSEGVWLNCKVENDDAIVTFVVDFREEFKDVVSLIEKGDIITFRGRFYDEGCGFTDCELIIE